MNDTVFLFTGCSFVSQTGDAGGGWVASCGGDIVFGNASWTGMRGVSDAEAAAALEGARYALDRFPGVGRLLVSSDHNEVQFAPWGTVAEGMEDDHDRTGLLGLCRSLGVRHAVRWWPGNRNGPDAADFLLSVARALGIQGRLGNRIEGRVDRAPGWRSALSRAVGHGPVNMSMKDLGLTRDKAAALTGLDADRIDALVASGRLRTVGPAGATLASAVQLRDEAERDGEVSWPAEDFGEAHVAALDAPSFARLYVSVSQLGDFQGVGTARTWNDGFKVSSTRFRSKPRSDPYKEAMAAALTTLARAMEAGDRPGVFDVVTTDPWLSKLLVGMPGTTPDIVAASDQLQASLRARGASVRVQLVRDGLVRAWRGNEPTALMACAMATSRIAAIRGSYAARGDTLDGEGDALLPRVEAEAEALRRNAARQAQDAVTGAVFDLAPELTESRARFVALAGEATASLKGYATVPRPVMPGPVDGEVMLGGEGGMWPCGASYEFPDGFPERWRAWGAEYAAILSANAVLALRDALLRVDPTTDLTQWTKNRHLWIERWIKGEDDACPFRIHPLGRRQVVRASMRGMLDACGGWPFKWYHPVEAAA